MTNDLTRAHRATLHDLVDRLDRSRLLLVFMLAMDADGFGAVPERSVERAFARIKVMRRYGQIRAVDPTASHSAIIRRTLADAVVKGILREHRMTCSRRSIQSWLRKWNETNDTGLARGWAGLVDRYGS